MINETNLAKYVNIMKSNRDDIPEDVYQYMAKKVNEKVKEITTTYSEYSKLNYLNIVRSFIKRCIMTIAYGVTKRGISNQLKEDHFVFAGLVNNKQTYRLKDDSFNKIKFDFYLTNVEINCLANILHEILYDTFSSLKDLVIYFKLMNKFLKELNLSPI